MSRSLVLNSAKALEYRREHHGLIGVESKVQLKDKSVLSVIYTPGVAAPCLEIAADAEKSFDYTCRGNTIALITDGSAVLQLGAIGPEAALPVLEARSVIFKTLAGIDALPLAMKRKNNAEFSQAIRQLEPTFGAICLDHISSPDIFMLERELQNTLNIPVIANTARGTAVSVAAALLNALKIQRKNLTQVKIILNGAGTAGLGTAQLLHTLGARNVIICDQRGALYKERHEGLNEAKREATSYSNPAGQKGNLAEVIAGAEVFIGISGKGVLTEELICRMAKNPIIFALALPEAEIDPAEALAAGAEIIATALIEGPNQIDMALALPGIIRGALEVRATAINDSMLMAAVHALAGLVKDDELSAHYLIPHILDFNVAPVVAAAVGKEARATGIARRERSGEEIEERVRTFIYEGRFPVAPRNRGEITDYATESLDLHIRYGGVLEIKSKIPIRDNYILSSYYLPPGATDAALIVSKDPRNAYDYTIKGNLVAIVTDGSAVLGLGNIGPHAALPVMEGKAILFHTFAGVEAFPICLGTQKVDEIIDIVKMLVPTFGGVNLEDIAAPRCFEIEERLRQETDIPIFHDDQHGTAVVVLAGLINALKLTGKKFSEITVVFNGAGAAGIAVTKLLLSVGLKNAIICDTQGAIYEGRPVGMNKLKEELAHITNPERRRGTLSEVLRGADVFIGTSVANAVTIEMVMTMAPQPIIFALANPVPEIMPAAAKKGGAVIVATGRSDLDNQVNNSLVFPGIFRGALDVRARNINEAMKIAAAEAIADLISAEELNAELIIPRALDFRVPPRVAAAVAKAAIATGEARLIGDPEKIANSTRNFIYEGMLKA